MEGPDGNLWFNGTVGHIGTINPTTDAITEFPLQTANDGVDAITAGPDGNVWFTGYNGSTSFIGAIDPTTHAVSEFTLPPPVNSVPTGITAGPDGNIWFTEQGGNQVGMINPTTHAISIIATNVGNPMRITSGPDGNIWFTENLSRIGMINPATDALTTFPINFSPLGITAGADGNLWFARPAGRRLATINATTHAITEFTTPTAGSYTGPITSGPDGNIWFTEENAGQVGTINLTSHVITEFSDTYTGSKPIAIASGPDGNIWFSDIGTHAIGVAVLDAPQLVVTQPPPTSVTAGGGFDLTVDIEDSSGNLVSSFDGRVSVALANNPRGTTLGGTLSVMASGGVATFSGVTINKAASGFTIVATSAGVGEAITGAITVTPAAPSQFFIFGQPPADVTAGNGFSVQAAIEDPYGNLVTSATNTVSLALSSNPGMTSLGGTLSVTPSQGDVTFSGLTLTKAAAGYTLQVSSSGLTAATTNSVTVTPAAAAQVVITQQPPATVAKDQALPCKRRSRTPTATW